MIRSLPGPAGDAALLLARILLGVVLIAHGWQKLVTNGFAGTVAGFDKMGVPLPSVSVGYALVVELAGGALLLLGAGTAVVGILVLLDMLGAAILVHIGNGLFVTDRGWELVGVIAAGALLLVGAGAGRFSIDHALATRHTTASG